MICNYLHRVSPRTHSPCSVFWVGMLIIGGIGIKYGKWQRLVYGTDYKGNVCGVDKSGQKFVTYPRTNEVRQTCVGVILAN